MLSSYDSAILKDQLLKLKPIPLEYRIILVLLNNNQSLRRARLTKILQNDARSEAINKALDLLLGRGIIEIVVLDVKALGRPSKVISLATGSIIALAGLIPSVATEIAVTPEMIAAGMKAAQEFGDNDPNELTFESVYRAMRRLEP